MEEGSFQKSPIRGRPNVSKLVPKKLTRSTTDDTQTAINRVVHEALARGGTVSSPEVAEEVKQRVAVVLQAKEDELTGRITHLQRLQLIKLVATLSVEEALEEARHLQSTAREDAEQKVKRTSMLPLIWRRMLCGYFLNLAEVLSLAVCCRFLRQDHALGLQCFVLPSHVEGEEDTVSTEALAMKPLPQPVLKRLVSKFRYAQKLVAGSRSFRLLDSELELLPLSQLRVLDLSFCYKLTASKLLEGLRSTLCLSELSLRGCSQLTSPGTEETLAGLNALVSLDVRGCSKLSSDSILHAVANSMTQLTTLRLGYSCIPALWPEHEVMPLETFSTAAFAELGRSAARLRHLEFDLGLMFRWSQREGAHVVVGAVKSLLSLKHLEALLLWNCLDLQQETFRSILDHLGEEVSTVGIDDCYHDYDSYFHVVPTSWGVRTARELYGNINADPFFPASGSGPGRSVLIGRNVTRDREILLQKTIQPLLERGCRPKQLVFQCEATLTGDALGLASEHLEELEMLTNCNAEEDILENFLCPLVRSCPSLRSLRLRTKGGMMLRIHLRGYEALLKSLTSCPRLETFDMRLMDDFSNWQETEQRQPVVEYYDDDRPITPGPAVHLNTLRELFRCCPLLTTVHLLPPMQMTRLDFWRFCSEAGFPQASIVLCVPPKAPNEDAHRELQLLQQIQETPVTELGVLHGFPLNADLSAAILRFGRLRRLGLRKVYWPGLRELLVPLAERCPDLEELWLRNISVAEDEAEIFIEALGRLQLRGLCLRELQPPSVEQMVAKALPGLVRQSGGSLQSLEMSGVFGSQAVLSVASEARQLRQLRVFGSEFKDEKGRQKEEPCPDFRGSEEELLLKLIARCPKLEALSVEWIRKPPEDSDEQKKEAVRRQAMQHGQKLCELSFLNVSYYTGLQYCDGHESTPPPAYDSDDD